MKYYHITLFIFIGLTAQSQQTKDAFDIKSIKEAGIPPTQHYEWDRDLGLSKPKGMQQHPNGLLYIACEEGIAEFDGSRWELIYREDKISNFRISDDGLIYIITSKDFGVLKKNTSGKYLFTSLFPNSNDKRENLGYARACFIIKNSVYFIYSKFIFQLKNQQVFSYETDGFIMSSFKIDDTIYIHDASSKVFTFKNGAYTLVEGTEQLSKKVFVIGTKIGSKLLIGDNLGQFYMYSNNKLTPQFKVPEDIGFKPMLFLPLDNHRIAIATKSKGLLIYSVEGELLCVLNRSKGLLSNKIKNFFLDKDKNLWVLYKEGVSKVEIFSPFSFYNDKNGVNEQIEFITEHHEKIYFASGNNVYEINEKQENILKNQKIKNILTAQNVYVFSYNDVLLLTSAEGLYAYKNNTLSKLTDSSCVFIIKSDVHENILYVSGDKGIDVYTDLGSDVPLTRRFRKFSEIVFSKPPMPGLNTDFMESKNGDLLVNLNFREIIKIKIKSIFPFQYTQEFMDLPVNGIIILYSLSGEPVLLIDGSLYKYNIDTGKLEEHCINREIKKLDLKPYFIVQKDSLSDIVISRGVRGKTVLLKENSKGDYITKRPFKRFPEFISSYIFQDSKGILWFGGEQGVTRFNPKLAKQTRITNKVFVRDFGISNKDSLIFKGIITNHDHVPKLAYSDNSIKLKYAFPDYSNTENNRFKFMLEGFNKKWSNWTFNSEKEFNNLSEGTYRLKIKAKNAYDQESATSFFTFTILPPWYRTWWVYLLYLIGFVGFVTIVVIWRSSKLKKEKEKLETTIKERTQEIIEKNKQLEIQATKLKEMDKVKSRFFANISHEFRTPITLIKGPVQEFIDNHNKEFELTKAKMVSRNADRLLQLVNQLLDLSKLDAGNLKLEAEEADLNHFLRSLGSAFNSYADQRNISYDIAISQNTLITSFDKDKVEKIVSNLLSNAFKYTPDNGEVKFSCSNENNKIKIIVSDTGIGISKEKLSYIFDRFYQVDASETRDQEGTGIGLALVKELVELNKGVIHVTSTPEQGTAFTVLLPLPYIKQNIKTHRYNTIGFTIKDDNTLLKNNNDQSSIKDVPIILVVEDNNDMRKYIIDYLKSEFRILEAADGRIGLEISQNEVPDLIISDVMMPKLDGISMCKQLKEDERTSHIPIVMLTAKAEQQDKLLGLDIGVDDYLVKPFDNNELKARVNNLIEQRNQLRKLYSRQVILEPKQVIIKPKEEVFLEKVIECIELNLSDDGFGVPQMQEMLLLSKTQLHRKMKALTDMAPGEFLRNYRLKIAAQLLAQQSDNISQVAYSVGFNSVSYFAKCFKVFYRVSPSEYIKLQIQNKSN
ncbi:ATP-binding protein [Aquimarina sp. 2304DJ70-9]|uniref:ATP-binding protein n=1 Tax=Aquimarina penaris TaxID=3231044 RepID=UPI0034630641